MEKAYILLIVFTLSLYRNGNIDCEGLAERTRSVFLIRRDIWKFYKRNGTFKYEIKYKESGLKDSSITNTNRKTPNKVVDTITYRPRLFSKTSIAENTTYKVDGKSVNKRTYVKNQKQLANTLTSCAPCWLINYDLEGRRIQEGLFYKKCLVGKSITYYKTGEVQIIHNYKINNKDNWKNYSCTVLDGVQAYFEKDGTIILTETYKDGKKIE